MDQIMTERVNQLEQWIQESDNVVFFGGAGVSTESGIPDFRSVDGLYNQQYAYPPETIISHSFYRRNPEEFYRFYKNKMLFPNAKPNAAHRALAKLEQQGHLHPGPRPPGSSGSKTTLRKILAPPWPSGGKRWTPPAPNSNAAAPRRNSSCPTSSSALGSMRTTKRTFSRSSTPWKRSASPARSSRAPLSTACN